MLQFDILKAWIQAHVARPSVAPRLVEYALLVALIAVVCIVAITSSAARPSDEFTRSATRSN